jgi:hypothetical protein
MGPLRQSVKRCQATELEVQRAPSEPRSLSEIDEFIGAWPKIMAFRTKMMLLRLAGHRSRPRYDCKLALSYVIAPELADRLALENELALKKCCTNSEH